MNTKNDLARITIDIPKKDHKRLKALSAILGKSMRNIVVESLEERLYSKKVLSKETLKTILDVEKRKGLIEAENIEDLFKKLGI